MATDFSDGADRALAIALKYATLLNARIDLVHVIVPAAPIHAGIPGAIPIPQLAPTIMDDLARRREDVERRLDEMAVRVRASGLECLTATLQGAPADEIVAHAARIAAELIVIGTQGRTGLRRMLLGSVAEQVLRKANIPVLVVPPAG